MLKYICNLVPSLKGGNGRRKKGQGFSKKKITLMKKIMGLEDSDFPFCN